MPEVSLDKETMDRIKRQVPCLDEMYKQVLSLAPDFSPRGRNV